MSKKTLNLHIGSPKTGSTSIQEIFAKNRQNLRYQGFNYPGKNLDHHFLYFASKAPRESWPRHFKGIEESKLRAYLIKYFKELEEGFQHEELSNHDEGKTPGEPDRSMLLAGPGPVFELTGRPPDRSQTVPRADETP